MMQWPSIGSVGFVGLIDKDRSGGKEVNWIDKKDGIKKNGWRRINVQIDSGALDTVIPKDIVPGTKVHETTASKNGIGYIAANATKINNYGDKLIKGRTDDGMDASMAMQCTDVTNTLGSVYRINQGGNQVWLDGNNSFLLNKKTGKKTKII